MQEMQQGNTISSDASGRNRQVDHLLNLEISHNNTNRLTSDLKKERTFNLRGRAQSYHEDLLSQPLPYSSNYYDDLTREKDFIRSAFEANNYTFIRDLPDAFQHRVILDQNRQRVEKAKEQAANPSLRPQQKVVKLKGGGCFEPFTFSDEVYEFARQIDKYDRLKSLSKRLEISEQDFKINDQTFKGKWEDPFRNNYSGQPQPPYIFPSYVPSDTYDVLSESKTRQRLINAARNIAGDFLPSKQEQVLHKPTKTELGVIVGELKFALETDWPDSKFIILPTPQDLIEVVFKLDPDSETDDPLAISMYFNSLLNDQRITPYGLTRSPAEWSKVNPAKNTISFCFRPPWVKTTNAAEFYKLHPDLLPLYRKTSKEM